MIIEKFIDISGLNEKSKRKNDILNKISHEIWNVIQGKDNQNNQLLSFDYQRIKSHFSNKEDAEKCFKSLIKLNTLINKNLHFNYENFLTNYMEYEIDAGEYKIYLVKINNVGNLNFKIKIIFKIYCKYLIFLIN